MEPLCLRSPVRGQSPGGGCALGPAARPSLWSITTPLAHCVVTAIVRDLLEPGSRQGLHLAARVIREIVLATPVPVSPRQPAIRSAAGTLASLGHRLAGSSIRKIARSVMGRHTNNRVGVATTPTALVESSGDWSRLRRSVDRHSGPRHRPVLTTPARRSTRCRHHPGRVLCETYASFSRIDPGQLLSLLFFHLLISAPVFVPTRSSPRRAWTVRRRTMPPMLTPAAPSGKRAAVFSHAGFGRSPARSRCRRS